MLNRRDVLAAAAALAIPVVARSQPAPPTITVGIPHSIGVAPLALAEQRGLFVKNGVNLLTQIVPRDDRRATLAAGKVDGVSVTMDAAISWAADNQVVTQVLLLNRSHGDDGLVARPGIADVAGLKGGRVACAAPGSSQYFFLAYVLAKAGLSVHDVELAVAEPAAAAAALLAGQCDAAVTAGAELAQAHAKPEAAKVLATTLDYPVMVTSLAFPSWFVAAQGVHLRGVVAGWFDALALIASDPGPSYATMAEWMGLDPAAFQARANLVEWPPRVKARAIMTSDLPGLMQQAAAVMMASGLIARTPDLAAMVDTQFVAA